MPPTVHVVFDAESPAAEACARVIATALRGGGLRASTRELPELTHVSADCTVVVLDDRLDPAGADLPDMQGHPFAVVGLSHGPLAEAAPSAWLDARLARSGGRRVHPVKRCAPTSAGFPRETVVAVLRWSWRGGQDARAA